jgi:hypothetical protein
MSRERKPASRGNIDKQAGMNRETKLINVALNVETCDACAILNAVLLRPLPVDAPRRQHETLENSEESSAKTTHIVQLLREHRQTLR